MTERLARVAGLLVPRWDPDQPRDENGRWTSGMPSVVSSADLSLGGLSGALESKPGGVITARLGDGEATFDRKIGGDVVNQALTRQTGVYDVPGADGNPVLRFAFGDAEDEDEEGEAGTPARMTFLDDGVSVDLSSSEVRKLQRETEYAIGSQRVETGGRDVDVYLTGQKFGWRTQLGSLDPVAFEFTEKYYNRVTAAHQAVMEGYDDGGDYGPVGADITELDVKTPDGRISISRSGPGNDAVITIAAVDRDDFAIQHTLDPHDPFLRAMDDAEASASEIGFHVLSARPPGQQVRQFGGTLMTTTRADAAAARARGVLQRVDRPSQRRNAERGGRAAARAVLSGVQLRDAATGQLEFEGHATVTERAYEMWDWYGPYNEVVSAGAFDATLSRGDLDVPLVLGHDQLRRIARTTNGTLQLSLDDTGLLVVAQLDAGDADVAYITPKLRSGLVDEMSFAFRIEAGTWSPDYTEYRIDKVDIHRGDVAIVGYGANPHTDSGLRADTKPASSRAKALLELAIARG